MKKGNNSEKRALMELREVINEMLNDNFKEHRMPKLMALKVTKKEIPLEVSSDEMVEEKLPEGALSAELGEEVAPDMEMSSDEGMEMEVKAPCECGKPDCDCAKLEIESEDSPEEDSDAVSRLKKLLMK